MTGKKERLKKKIEDKTVRLQMYKDKEAYMLSKSGIKSYGSAAGARNAITSIWRRSEKRSMSWKRKSKSWKTGQRGLNREELSG